MKVSFPSPVKTESQGIHADKDIVTGEMLSGATSHKPE